MDRSAQLPLERRVRSALPAQAFLPVPSRLWWLPVHAALFTGCVTFGVWLMQTGGHVAWLVLPALLSGLSFAGLAFVAHEALHGALCRSGPLRRVAGAVGFFPFLVAPRLWIAWHNRVHHGNTNVDGRDPDAYPGVAEYKSSLIARLAVDLAAPRLGKWRGLITLFLGFSIQSTQVLVMARARGLLNARHYRIALLQTLASASLWALFAWAVGPALFIALYVVPLLIANSIVMAHIATNHSLSPLTDQNDALASSLSVTVPPWFNFYTLGFGYHVEHHLFPSMSHKYGPLVKAQLQELAPDSYQSMPLTQALYITFTTPRVYQTQNTLVDLETGTEWRTLGPRALAPLRAAQTPLLAALENNVNVIVPAVALPIAIPLAPAAPLAPVTRRVSSIPPPPQAA
jgi:fatty acid desaturase